MFNGIGKLSSVSTTNVKMCIGKWSSVSTTNLCRREGDVLLNTLEDELDTWVPLLLKTKLTLILPPYMLRLRGSSLKSAFRL